MSDSVNLKDSLKELASLLMMIFEKYFDDTSGIQNLLVNLLRFIHDAGLSDYISILDVDYSRRNVSNSHAFDSHNFYDWLKSIANLLFRNAQYDEKKRLYNLIVKYVLPFATHSDDMSATPPHMIEIYHKLANFETLDIIFSNASFLKLLFVTLTNNYSYRLYPIDDTWHNFINYTPTIKWNDLNTTLTYYDFEEPLHHISKIYHTDTITFTSFLGILYLIGEYELNNTSTSTSTTTSKKGGNVLEQFRLFQYNPLHIILHTLSSQILQTKLNTLVILLQAHMSDIKDANIWSSLVHSQYNTSLTTWNSKNSSKLTFDFIHVIWFLRESNLFSITRRDWLILYDIILKYFPPIKMTHRIKSEHATIKKEIETLKLSIPITQFSLFICRVIEDFTKISYSSLTSGLTGTDELTRNALYLSHVCPSVLYSTRHMPTGPLAIFYTMDSIDTYKNNTKNWNTRISKLFVSACQGVDATVDLMNTEMYTYTTMSHILKYFYDKNIISLYISEESFLLLCQSIIGIQLHIHSDKSMYQYIKFFIHDFREIIFCLSVLYMDTMNSYTKLVSSSTQESMNTSTSPRNSIMSVSNEYIQLQKSLQLLQNDVNYDLIYKSVEDFIVYLESSQCSIQQVKELITTVTSAVTPLNVSYPLENSIIEYEVKSPGVNNNRKQMTAASECTPALTSDIPVRATTTTTNTNQIFKNEDDIMMDDTTGKMKERRSKLRSSRGKVEGISKVDLNSSFTQDISMISLPIQDFNTSIQMKIQSNKASQSIERTSMNKSIRKIQQLETYDINTKDVQNLLSHSAAMVTESPIKKPSKLSNRGKDHRSHIMSDNSEDDNRRISYSTIYQHLHSPTNQKKKNKSSFRTSIIPELSDDDDEDDDYEDTDELDDEYEEDDEEEEEEEEDVLIISRNFDEEGNSGDNIREHHLNRSRLSTQSKASHNNSSNHDRLIQEILILLCHYPVNSYHITPWTIMNMYTDVISSYDLDDEDNDEDDDDDEEPNDHINKRKSRNNKNKQKNKNNNNKKRNEALDQLLILIFQEFCDLSLLTMEELEFYFSTLYDETSPNDSTTTPIIATTTTTTTMSVSGDKTKQNPMKYFQDRKKLLSDPIFDYLLFTESIIHYLSKHEDILFFEYRRCRMIQKYDDPFTTDIVTPFPSITNCEYYPEATMCSEKGCLDWAIQTLNISYDVAQYHYENTVKLSITVMNDPSNPESFYFSSKPAHQLSFSLFIIYAIRCFIYKYTHNTHTHTHTHDLSHVHVDALPLNQSNIMELNLTTTTITQFETILSQMIQTFESHITHIQTILSLSVPLLSIIKATDTPSSSSSSSSQIPSNERSLMDRRSTIQFNHIYTRSTIIPSSASSTTAPVTNSSTVSSNHAVKLTMKDELRILQILYERFQSTYKVVSTTTNTNTNTTTSMDFSHIPPRPPSNLFDASKFIEFCKFCGILDYVDSWTEIWNMFNGNQYSAFKSTTSSSSSNSSSNNSSSSGGSEYPMIVSKSTMDPIRSTAEFLYKVISYIQLSLNKKYTMTANGLGSKNSSSNSSEGMSQFHIDIYMDCLLPIAIALTYHPIGVSTSQSQSHDASVNPEMNTQLYSNIKQLDDLLRYGGNLMMNSFVQYRDYINDVFKYIRNTDFKDMQNKVNTDGFVSTYMSDQHEISLPSACRFLSCHGLLKAGTIAGQAKRSLYSRKRQIYHTTKYANPMQRNNRYFVGIFLSLLEFHELFIRCALMCWEISGALNKNKQCLDPTRFALDTTQINTQNMNIPLDPKTGFLHQKGVSSMTEKKMGMEIPSSQYYCQECYTYFSEQESSPIITNNTTHNSTTKSTSGRGNKSSTDWGIDFIVPYVKTLQYYNSHIYKDPTISATPVMSMTRRSSMRRDKSMMNSNNNKKSTMIESVDARPPGMTTIALRSPRGPPAMGVRYNNDDNKNRINTKNIQNASENSIPSASPPLSISSTGLPPAVVVGGGGPAVRSSIINTPSFSPKEIVGLYETSKELLWPIYATFCSCGDSYQPGMLSGPNLFSLLSKMGLMNENTTLSKLGKLLYHISTQFNPMNSHILTASHKSNISNTHSSASKNMTIPPSLTFEEFLVFLCIFSEIRTSTTDISEYLVLIDSVLESVLAKEHNHPQHHFITDSSSSSPPTSSPTKQHSIAEQWFLHWQQYMLTSSTFHNILKEFIQPIRKKHLIAFPEDARHRDEYLLLFSYDIVQVIERIESIWNEYYIHTIKTINWNPKETERKKMMVRMVQSLLSKLQINIIESSFDYIINDIQPEGYHHLSSKALSTSYPTTTTTTTTTATNVTINAMISNSSKSHMSTESTISEQHSNKPTLEFIHFEWILCISLYEYACKDLSRDFNSIRIHMNKIITELKSLLLSVRKEANISM